MKKNQGHSKLSRRDFLASTAASFAAAGLMGAGCGNGMKRPFSKREIPVGVQLYSVRSECAKDLPGTIGKVAAMGYDGVEFAGYYDYSAKDLRRILDDNGLKCCGTHTQMDTLSDANLEATIEFNKTLGNRYLIVPWLQASGDNPKQIWLDYAKQFNELAEKVSVHGMVVGYHCHAHDFHAINGEVPWDLLFGNTGKHVVMQMDTANCMAGGGHPVEYLRKYPGRSLTVHLKEHSETNPNAILGEGDVPWDEVFTVCETIGGTQWYIIEEEKDVYPPLEAIELCLKNYRKMRA